MVECRSHPQMCLLGPVSPRTPGRSHAHVPSDSSRGESKYGRIPFVYFYREGAKADTAFDLLDIERDQIATWTECRYRWLRLPATK